MIQRPSAYLSPVQIDIDESYLNVPIIRQIELHTINNLPTKFRWTEVNQTLFFLQNQIFVCLFTSANISRSNTMFNRNQSTRGHSLSK